MERENSTSVAQMAMAFIHDGIPKPTRKAVYRAPEMVEPHVAVPQDFAAEVHALLGMPSIASKHWIIRQYDHEVQGGTVIKPLVGARGTARAMRAWCGRWRGARRAWRWRWAASRGLGTSIRIRWR